MANPPGPNAAPPLSTEAFRQLADTVDGHTRAGRWAEAEAACRAALVGRPGDGPLLQMLGITLVRAGRLPEALEVLRRSAAVWPQPQAWMTLGMTLLAARQRGEPADEAIAAFGRASAGRPGWVEADLRLGQLLLDVGRPADAVVACRRAVAARPDWAGTLVPLGNALFAAADLDGALAAYRRAAALDPADPNAVLNVGNALAKQHKYAEAIVAFRQSLTLRPNDRKALNNLATALYLSGHLDEAEGIYGRLTAEGPADAGTLVNVAGLLKDKGRLDDSIAVGRQAMAADPGYLAVHSNLIYTLSFHPGYDAAAVLAEARAFDRQHTAGLTALARPHGNDRSPGRRLRVGYVSPDLKHHAVGHFMVPLVEAHDPAVVDVRLYGLGVRADEVTDRLRRSAAGWRDLGGLSDEAAAEAIRADGVDVLVDLTLHMGHNRLPIFARRPAPVQVTYLAYAGTSGLAAMDYRLSDPYLDPTVEGDADYSERTVRLRRTYWCYRPTHDVAVVADPPVVRTGAVTFGSLNNFCKVNDAVLDAWAEVMNRVPGSRLLIHAQPGDHRDGVTAFLAGRGVAADRVAFVGMVHTRQYLGQHNDVDVVLDPFPYNGGTTTCDALWMGVPVVSLAVDRAVGRAGRSILTNVGLADLAVDTVDDYVTTAVALAGDVPRLRDLRRTLRDRMLASPLMDEAGFARDVEAAYRTMWQAWCEGPTLA